MSDVSPEAAPEAAPAEVPGGEGESQDAGPAPEAGQGAAELDISQLPEQAQEYIRELREEAKGYRKQYEPFKNAFSHFNEAEQEYLVNMVDQLGVNQDTGAQAMLDLSQRLLGIEAAAEEAANDPEAIQEAEDAGMTEEQYRAMVREELQQEQLLAQVEAETRAVGFDPESKEAQVLWDMAVSLNETDLTKVAPLVRQHLGLPDPENAEAQPDPEPEAPATERWPVNVGASGNGDTNAEDREPPPAIGSDALRERVRRRLEASPGQ